MPKSFQGAFSQLEIPQNHMVEQTIIWHFPGNCDEWVAFKMVLLYTLLWCFEGIGHCKNSTIIGGNQSSLFKVHFERRGIEDNVHDGAKNQRFFIEFTFKQRFSKEF